MYRVLLIDDEPNILSAMRRCLSAIDSEQLDGESLAIETFTNPDDAIARSEEQDFDLIVSDYRMPLMNGVELLSRLIEAQPTVPRMIVSGYADKDAIISAVNDTNIARFINKPWSDNQLRDTVVSLLKRGRSGANENARQRAPADRAMKRLEEECPGITFVERDEDGGIYLSLDDDD
ncbi:response regulator [Tahibacter amnicola]|uniref:Response regulator n=1 Tax=Tahibacter amnicola TaxID=2976241 RepID=A0ABY6BHI6_9GAMM|nr:response regulator [Tahibacter amnicola]UXI67317.1 response regulator [Tahibacter amnicola]